MERSNEKTVIRVPTHGTEHGNCLGKGHVLQGRYVIEAELGAGGFGITYLAKHRYLEDIWVAIKEYLPDGAAVRDAGSRVHVISERYTKMYSWGLHRFLDEARLLRQFDHPNIVSVQDFFEANNTAYLVMNYVRGRSLQKELDAGRVFDEDKLRSITYPLLDALQCIHRAELYHRDISPDNILLREEDDTPVLIDFGSARYAMRMHGAEKIKGGQGYTPTAIFKQGYSPIEQYEGTDQGPYTDVYALGATLYRAAFGTRPIDALKRSGELRLKKVDPLEPASEKGQGKFSKRFLRAIDSALRLEAGQRPQTIEAWLTILGRSAHPLTSSALLASPRSSWRTRALVAGTLLAATVGVLAYFSIDIYPLNEEDVPSLLSRADKQLDKEPFSARGLEEAQSLYLQVLTLDQENAQALSGYRATNLLKQFSDAVEKEDLGKAVARLDQAEAELRNAGVDPSVLAPSRERVKLLESQASLRGAISSQPLSPDAWPRISLLLDEIATLQGGKPVAEAGKSGLKALKAAAAAIRKNDFESAWSDLADAEHRLSPLGIEQLPVARSEIQSIQRDLQAARDAEIERLLAIAGRHANTAPVTSQQLQQALQVYREVLGLDPKQPMATAGLTVSESLLEVLTNIESNDFASADQALSAARSSSGDASLWNSALENAGRQLTAARQAWSLSETLRSSKALRAQAANRLIAAPFDAEALSEAGRLFQEAQALSSQTAGLEAETRAALAGSELVQALQDTKRQIDNADFVDARARLKDGEILTLSGRVDLGGTFVANAEQALTSAEIGWNLTQAATLLGRDLWDGKAQDEAQRHLDRVQELDPRHAPGAGASKAVNVLRNTSLSRQNHDYEAAITSLQEAKQTLLELGISANLFESAEASMRTEQKNWEAQQRAQDIDSKLAEAFGFLRRRPFDSASWEKADSFFGVVSSIAGGAEQADSGRRILAALQAAKAEMDAARFDDAQAQIDNAEEILGSLGAGDLDEARKLVTQAKRSWEAERQQRIAAALASAEGVLGGMAPTPELLQQTRKAYRTALDLDPNQEQAQAGLSVIRSLEVFLQLLQAFEFDRAQEHLAAAESAAESAGLGPGLIEAGNALLSAQREAWDADQARQQILTLRARVSDLLSNAPPSEESLALAEQALQDAAKLGQAHQELESYTSQTMSAVEVVILLRAFMAELEQEQFDAASNTLSEIGQRLSEAELDPAVLENASNLAVSAQVEWHLADAAHSLSRGLGILISGVGLDAAEAHYAAVKELTPARTEIDSGLEGVDKLRRMVAAHSRREYQEALTLLDQAATELPAVGVADNAFDPVRQQLTREWQLWQTLTRERDVNTWTSEAIRAMDRAPFADATWVEVESLAEMITDVSSDDRRGLAVKAALEGMRQARGAIEAEHFGEARAYIEQAQSELGAIGVRYSLNNAVRELDATLNTALERLLRVAGDALSEDSLSEDKLVTAETALERILAFLPNHPIAKAGVAAIDLIRGATAAMSTTEFAKSAKLLGDADRQLRPLVTTDAPVPQLRETLADARRQLAKQRPSPGEIYPLIGAALQAITRDPLGTGMLDSADKLLRNVVAMQADQPAALAGLQAVDQLRIASQALAEGAPEDAQASLQHARELLVSIGLSPAVLESAWPAVDVPTAME